MEFGDELRVKAMSFVTSLVRIKRRAIIKLKLVTPLLSWLFPIMCTLRGDEDESELYEENEAHSPAAVAAQVLDCMAMNLAPEKLMPAVCVLVEQELTSADPSHRAAAYMAMAVVAEGCADYIMSRYSRCLLAGFDASASHVTCCYRDVLLMFRLLRPWLQHVYKGLEDSAELVHNVALFAMGQFAECLQPKISKFSKELIPLLFQNIAKAQANIDKNAEG